MVKENKTICKTCKFGIHDGRSNRMETRLKNMKRVGTISQKGLHRSDQGDWEAHDYAIYRCKKCKRYYKYTRSEDWEPVGIGVWENLDEIDKKKAEELLKEKNMS